MSFAFGPRRDWRLLHDWRVAAGAAAPASSNLDHRESPFIGREDLLRRLRELAVVARSGRGRVVALLGEAGIGKTRLLRQFAASEAARGLDTTWIGGAAPAAWTGPIAPAPPLAGGPIAPAMVLTGGVPEPTPRLLVYDAGASPQGADLLAGLAARDLAREPVLLIVVPPREGVAGASMRPLLSSIARQRILVELTVPPLDESELFELARHLVGAAPNGRLQAAISELSEGNPFFAESVALDLAELGRIACADGTASLLGDLAWDYVPAAVASSLRYDLESIDTQELHVLSAAAALGTGFRIDVLTATLQASAPHVLTRLEAGVARGVLREASEPPDDFQFTHELTRRMLYRRLGGARRRELHHVMMTALGDDVPDIPAFGEDAPRLRRLARGADVRRALDSTLRALWRAERLCAWDDAIRYCREALDLLRQLDGSDESLELDLLERLGALYFGQAQTFASGACWREAVRLCEASDRPVEQTVFTARLAGLGPSWATIDAAERLLAGAAQVANDDRHRATWLSDAFLSVGFVHQRLGSIPRAIDHFRAARCLADPADWTRAALTDVSLASALTSAGEVGEALSMLRPALDVVGSRLPEVLVGDERILYYRDPRRLRCLILEELARALAFLGQTDEAVTLARESHADQRRLRIIGAQGHGAVALVELRRGQPRAALEAFRSRLRETPDGLLSAHRTADLAILSSAQLADGDAATALDTATAGIRVSERTGAREYLATLQTVAAEALLACHRAGSAADMIAAAYQTIDATGTEIARPEADRVRAIVQAARDTATDARGRQDGRCAADNRPRRSHRRAATTASPRAPLLSAREREVLKLMADGRTNRQVAAALTISDLTVKRHLSNIFDKLGVNTRAAVVRRAFEEGLL